jgi:S-DNA-T family DNA segregation ATPase FtsK/SpoIIIE
MNNNEWDPMLADAAWLIVSEQNTSTSMLQMRMKLGYNKAGRLLDQMEALGIVGPFKGTISRELYVKGEEALIKILDGAGISHTSFHETNHKSEHPD